VFKNRNIAVWHFRVGTPCLTVRLNEEYNGLEMQQILDKTRNISTFCLEGLQGDLYMSGRIILK
jgi:hypothetical protein